MSLPATQFAKDAHAAHVRMVEVLPKPLLEAPRALRECVNRGVVYRQQNDGDRISDNLVHLRMKWEAVV